MRTGRRLKRREAGNRQDGARQRQEEAAEESSVDDQWLARWFCSFFYRLSSTFGLGSLLVSTQSQGGPLFSFLNLSSLQKCFLSPYAKLGTALDPGESGRAEADALLSPVGPWERQHLYL